MSIDGRKYNQDSKDYYDIIGKDAARRLIAIRFPGYSEIPTEEKFKAGDLFYEDAAGKMIIFEAEARSTGNWADIWENKNNGMFEVRIPNRKNPFKYTECKWDYYIQCGDTVADQGVIFKRDAIRKGAKILTRDFKDTDGVWKPGKFVYPRPDEIDFYEIKDGNVVIVP
jgi:hypothetical protein